MSDTSSRELDAALEAVAGMAAPALPALPAALEAELGALQPVTTRRPLRQLALLAAASLAYLALLLALLHVRRDLRQLPVEYLVAAGAAWAFGFVAPCYFALVPRSGTVLPRWKHAAIAAAITAVGFIVLGLLVHPHGPDTTNYGWSRFARGHTCLELGMLTALVPVVLGSLFLRGALPIQSRWVAAGLGAGAGCLGGLFLHLHCRVGDLLHVGLMHGGVVALSALLAAVIVPRTTDLR